MEFDHFLHAQKNQYEDVKRELAAGRKQTHWMWFIFPQLRGLGSSPAAQRFALDSVDQARRYLRHPILGPRLRECTRLAIEADAPSAQTLFGSPDWMKFRSCITLFDLAAEETETVFREALDRYYNGEPDSRTLTLLDE